MYTEGRLNNNRIWVPPFSDITNHMQSSHVSFAAAPDCLNLSPHSTLLILLLAVLTIATAGCDNHNDGDSD